MRIDRIFPELRTDDVLLDYCKVNSILVDDFVVLCSNSNLLGTFSISPTRDNMKSESFFDTNRECITLMVNLPIQTCLAIGVDKHISLRTTREVASVVTKLRIEFPEMYYNLYVDVIHEVSHAMDFILGIVPKDEYNRAGGEIDYASDIIERGPVINQVVKMRRTGYSDEEISNRLWEQHAFDTKRDALRVVKRIAVINLFGRSVTKTSLLVG